MRFLLGTSFFHDSNNPQKVEMMSLWHRNIPREASNVVALYEGSTIPMVSPAQAVRLTGDLGHIGAHLNGSKPHHLTGWSASVCALAMLAYINEADFIYKESDCLAFGPWVQQLYQDAEGVEFVFGPKMTSAPWMTCAQSLFLVKHHFIPAFVSVFLSLPPDRAMLGEDKFCHLEGVYPHLTRRMSFGVDRMRPIPWDAPVFYFQQPTQLDLDEAKRRKLI